MAVAAPKFLFSMAYKVIKDGFCCALIFDGKQLYKALLSNATQEQLAELYNLRVEHIERDADTAETKFERDNNHNAPIPTAPKLEDNATEETGSNEPKTTKAKKKASKKNISE